MQITKIPAKPKEYKTLRVAAYARVSADKDAAFHSLEAQTEYYEKYVEDYRIFEEVNPCLLLPLSYIEFAQEETQLFKLLFINDMDLERLIS